MTSPQKTVLSAAAAAISFALAYPPFNVQGESGAVVNVGYSTLWNPPYDGAASVDEPMLAAEYAAILLVVGLLYVRLRPDRKPASPPTAAQLDALVPHVAYEAAALESSAKLYLERADRFAFEAFLVHVRLLRDFLWHSWNPTDRFSSSSVLAEHFFSHPLRWRARRGSLPRTLARTRTAIDKQLAHLSRQRADTVSTQDLQQAVPALRDELVSCWAGFLDALSEDARGPVLRREYASWRMTLGLDVAA